MKSLVKIAPNYFYSLSTNIKNTARLPLSVCRGSERERFELAQRYSDMLSEHLDKCSKNDSCSVDDFTQGISNILGKNKIKFVINRNHSVISRGSLGRKTSSESFTYSLGDIFYTHSTTNIEGYNFELPLSKDKTRIKSKEVAIHEARHFFDHVCNPKLTDFRTLKLVHDDEAIKLNRRVYERFVGMSAFVPKCVLKKLVEHDLNKMNDEHAIEALQTVRATLKTEINAYNDGIKYLKKKPVKNMFAILNTADIKYSCKYEQKLKLANELLAQRLKLARESIHIEQKSSKSKTSLQDDFRLSLGLSDNS